MKTIDDGRWFDTETATKICDVPCEYPPSDDRWHRTALYVTDNHVFFVAGEGNAHSRWSVLKQSRERQPGKMIGEAYPVYIKNQLLELGQESHLQNLFGKPAFIHPDAETVFVSLPTTLVNALEDRAEALEKTVGEYCGEIVAERLQERLKE